MDKTEDIKPLKNNLRIYHIAGYCEFYSSDILGIFELFGYCKKKNKVMTIPGSTKSICYNPDQIILIEEI